LMMDGTPRHPDPDLRSDYGPDILLFSLLY
jgi:hypothetical protein